MTKTGIAPLDAPDLPFCARQHRARAGILARRDVGMTSDDQFQIAWEPRIGPAATVLLRRQQRHRGVKFAIMAGSVIGGPALFWSVGGLIGIFLAIVWWIYAIVIFVNARRGLSGVADEVSKFYGSPVRGLPVMNTRSFDRWAEKRGLRPRP
jgi:hypothetical protein